MTSTSNTSKDDYDDNIPSSWKRRKRTSEEMASEVLFGVVTTTTATATTATATATSSSSCVTKRNSTTPLLLSTNITPPPMTMMKNMPTNHTTHITMIHQQHQIDTLQMQLQHERDKYKLEGKKLQHNTETIQQQYSIAKKELERMNELYNETQRNYEHQLNDVTMAHDAALQQNRQLSLQLEQMRYHYSHRPQRRSTDHDDDAAVEEDEEGGGGGEKSTIPYIRNDDEMVDAELHTYQVLNQQLQQTIRNYAQNEVTYQQEMESVKERVYEKLQSIANNSEKKRDENEQQEQLYEEAPKTILQELNTCRDQLSTALRQNRQYERQSQYDQQQYQTLLRNHHELIQEQQHYPTYETIQEQYQSLRQQYNQMEAEHLVNTEFIQQVHEIITNSNSNNNNNNNNNFKQPPRGPPELATILRFLKEAKKQPPPRQHTTTSNGSSTSTTTVDDNTDGTGNNKNKNSIATDDTMKEQRDYEIELQSVQDKCDIANHQLLIYQREITSYKSLLQTYEQQQMMMMQQSLSPSKQQTKSGDMTTTTAPSATISNINVKFDTLHIEYKSLKELYEQLQTSNDTVLSELQTCQFERNKMQSDYDQVQTKYRQIRHAIKVEQERRTTLEQQLIVAEQLMGKGNYNSDHTRILHVSETPLIQALKEEVTVLKRQLETVLLQQQKSTTTGLLSPSDTNLSDSSMLFLLPSSSSSTTTAAATMPNPEKVVQRLKEQFKEQIGLFREGVYRMTGYKIDMIAAAPSPAGNDDSGGGIQTRPTFRLRSVFAEREEDQLLLQWPTTSSNANNNSKSLDLLQTDFAMYLMTTSSYEYISKLHNIPAFLASVQLMLFEKQTVMM